MSPDYERLAKERADIEAELIAALEIVDRLRAERLRVHNAIGALIGAPVVAEGA